MMELFGLLFWFLNQDLKEKSELICMDSLIHISPKFESLPLCINGSYLKLVQWEGGYT